MIKTTLKRMVVMLAAVMLVPACLAPALAQSIASNGRALAFTHVTVIDATGAPPKPNQTVVVMGNRIAAIGRFGQVPIPRGALVTDSQGKFLIPGLWDMHTHAFIRSRMSFPLYVMYLFLANGVTGVRDMGSLGERDDFGDYPYLQDLEWRQAIDEAAVLGPRLNLALTIINGPHVSGYPRDWAAVANAAEARREVDYLKKLGADFIKVYDQLSPEAYYAIADESKKQNLLFAGHVPILISAAEASDAGQKSLEHNYSVLFGCSTEEKELMQKEEDLFGAGKPAMRGILRLEDVKTLVNTFSEEKAAGLFAKFVKNDTYVTPTLIRARVERELPENPWAKYLSPALRSYVFPATSRPPNPQALEAQRLMYAYQVRLVGAMRRAGVKMLAGTDSSFFGSSLHDELEELVKAGLTPMEALQTATRNPAEYFKKLDSMGTIEKGKLADLVLLNGDPLVSIENTRKISAVIANGRLLDRQALASMLAQVESTNATAR